MPEIENQRILRIEGKKTSIPDVEFITEDVVEVQQAKILYYKWISRLMAFLAVCSLLYTVLSVLVILKLVPEIMIDAQIFVEMSDSTEIVKREHINPKMESREKIMINFMKQYVELRNTFIRDQSEMQKRWLWGGLISYLSTLQVYKNFEKFYPTVVEEMKDSTKSRSVEILNVSRTGGEKSYVWKVEFKTYDFTYGNEREYSSTRKIGPEIEERFWTANIGCRADRNRRLAYKRLINPLGFTVYSYFQTEIEN